MTVFPPSSLPGGSANWARQVEKALKDTSNTLASTSSSLNNVGRASEGQLATSAGLIEELLNRGMEVANLNQMSVTGDATAPPFPSTSQTHTFAAVPGNRTGFLSFQALYSSDPDSVTSNPLVFVRLSGNRLMRMGADITPGTGISPEESAVFGTVRGFCRVGLPNNEPVPIEVVLYRTGGSTASTLTLSDITLSLTRSGA